MTRCKTCDGTAAHRLWGIQFYRTPEFDAEQGCLVHRIVPDTGKPSWIVFCSNDPRAVARAREVGRTGQRKRAN